MFSATEVLGLKLPYIKMVTIIYTHQSMKIFKLGENGIQSSTPNQLKVKKKKKFLVTMSLQHGDKSLEVTVLSSGRKELQQLVFAFLFVNRINKVVC